MRSRLLTFSLVALALLVGCSQPDGSRGQTAGQKASTTQQLEKATTSPDAIRVATFNIQNFGPTKAGKPETMATLAAIIRKYDIVAVQEVSDTSGRAPQALLTEVNRSAEYGLLLSERTGKQPDDRTSQEAYAFFYRKTTVTPRDNGMIYPDDDHDYFQREPYVAGFVAGGQKLVLITIHTRPEAAVEEIGALAHVIDWARTRYPGEDDFVTLGDFNGSGTYAKPADLARLRTTLPYLWVVPDDSDSNVSGTTAAAYDRIIITNGLRPSYRSTWGVDRAFTDKAVSDHWPVWFELVRPGAN